MKNWNDAVYLFRFCFLYTFSATALYAQPAREPSIGKNTGFNVDPPFMPRQPQQPHQPQQQPQQQHSQQQQQPQPAYSVNSSSFGAPFTPPCFFDSLNPQFNLGAGGGGGGGGGGGIRGGVAHSSPDD